MTSVNLDTLDAPRGAFLGRLRRFGLAGFLFFLAKGLVWLAVAATAWTF